MPGKPWDNSGAPTAAEQRLDELFGHGKPWGRRVEEPANPLDVHAREFDPEREIRGEYLTRKLLESPDDAGWRAFWRRGGQRPVIRVTDAVITGEVDLRASDLPYLLEFVRCRFDHRPDLRQVTLAGLVFSGCLLPGLSARNLTTSNDTELVGCHCEGEINLADAEVGGSLLLDESVLRRPGRRALYADRLQVSGALLGIHLSVAGELRIPGVKVGGNVNFSGSTLRNRGRLAVNANGIQVGGSLRCDRDPRGRGPFTMAGLLYLPSAHIQGDLRLRDAVLEPGIAAKRRGQSQHDDPTATLLADRSEIRGDIQLDEGFRSGGTIRMVSATIGGDLRMSRARIDLSWCHPRQLRTLNLASTEIAGNLDARAVTLNGEIRMVDAHVRGSFQLNKATLTSPGTAALHANRVHVGSNLSCRDAEIAGSLQLQAARLGANFDLRATRLVEPDWHPHRQRYKPSLDLRAARVERDLICALGQRPFNARGEVQLRRAVVARQVNFWGCLLAGTESLNAFGLVTQELTVLPSVAPSGRVELQQAQCELFTDNAELWTARGGVDVEDFRYDNFSESIEPTDPSRVHERLNWLNTTLDGQYQPGPYDQLASVFRSSGYEGHAVTVLVEKQRRRFHAIAKASPLPLRPGVHLWSLLQLVTVSYGYRPLRALLWLMLCAAGGTAWFVAHPLAPINHEDHPVWDPLLYTVDQLLPIVDLGHDVMWRATGSSQWITVALIAAGWILATTVAAGITRTLRRREN